MSRDKWKIIGKSDDCGCCKIPAAAKHPVTSVGCVCKYLPVAARLREPIRGEAGDSGDASATPAADRSSGRITHVSARQRMLFGEVAAVRGNQQQRREARLLPIYDMAAGH